LAPATGAPGACTPSPSAAAPLVARHANVHRIPPHDRDDAFAPHAGTGCDYDNHNFLKDGSEIFFAGGLDRVFAQPPDGQINPN